MTPSVAHSPRGHLTPGAPVDGPFRFWRMAPLAAIARASIDEQAAIEAADSMPFEVYRTAYLDTARLGGPRVTPKAW